MNRALQAIQKVQTKNPVISHNLSANCIAGYKTSIKTNIHCYELIHLQFTNVRFARNNQNIDN